MKGTLWQRGGAAAALEPEFVRPLPSRAAATLRHRHPGAQPARRRLALVSVYHELCGIASYARALEVQLADAFDVTVFDLDQFLLRSTHPRLRRLADRHIREICRAIARFDTVNLQLEHGTLGRSDRDIYRRFGWILQAAPAISVTFHTNFTVQPVGLKNRIRHLSRLTLAGAAAALSPPRGSRQHPLLATGIPNRLRKAQNAKPVAVIVHNRHDALQMQHLHRIRQVYHHPLSFLQPAEVEQVRRTASRQKFILLDGVPEGTNLIGVFGFYGKYKGLDTVVRAMHHLPDNYHLLIFGGVHPNEIKREQPLDPLLSQLFDAAFVDTSMADRLRRPEAGGGTAVSLVLDSATRDLLIQHPKDLSPRIHFLGATSDIEFLWGMAICDAVVFPYLEVGQSASGPISQALELGCRLLASRTRTFLQFGRYHPNRLEYFDIGNHLELAGRLKSQPQYTTRDRPLAYTVETNKMVYIAANGGDPSHAEPRNRLHPTPAVDRASSAPT